MSGRLGCFEVIDIYPIRWSASHLGVEGGLSTRRNRGVHGTVDPRYHIALGVEPIDDKPQVLCCVPAIVMDRPGDPGMAVLAVPRYPGPELYGEQPAEVFGPRDAGGHRPKYGGRQ